MKVLRPLILSAALLLAAAPILAYTIVLKDGSTIIAQKEPKIENDKAFILLQNGTRTFIAASKIDPKKTKEANLDEYGSALVIEGGKVRQLKRNETIQRQGRKGLADLVAGSQARQRNPTKNQGTNFGSPAGTRPAPRQLETTKAGFPDLLSFPRKPYGDLDVSAEIQRTFRSQGLDQIQVYRGTTSGQPLVEVAANSEGAVFRAVAVGAKTLQQIRNHAPGKVKGLQLVLLTQAFDRAGQFIIDPQMAEELLTQKTAIEPFFLKYVQF